MSDPVNHPKHYKAGGIEAIDVIESFGLGFHLGNVVKYILRAGRKGYGDEDLRKARWYLDRRIEGVGDTDAARRGELTYLATPYTKYKPGIDQAFVDAAKLAAHLLKTGIRVYSPIVHCHPLSVHGRIDPLDHAIWLPFNETMLALADVLVVARLDGWDESHGVAVEIKAFEDTQRPIFDMDPKTLVMTPRKAELRVVSA